MRRSSRSAGGMAETGSRIGCRPERACRPTKPHHRICRTNWRGAGNYRDGAILLGACPVWISSGAVLNIMMTRFGSTSNACGRGWLWPRRTGLSDLDLLFLTDHAGGKAPASGRTDALYSWDLGLKVGRTGEPSVYPWHRKTRRSDWPSGNRHIAGAVALYVDRAFHRHVARMKPARWLSKPANGSPMNGYTTWSSRICRRQGGLRTFAVLGCQICPARQRHRYCRQNSA